MTEITLVTSFFNIGRERFKAIPRTDSTYIKNFKFWARIKNPLVVYTDACTAEVVKDVRASFGLADKTIVKIIDDIFELEPSIYERMCEIKSTHWFEDFRYLPNATSNIPEYSYLMLLKTWCLNDAVRSGFVNTKYTCWIDFGFNHGGKLYSNPEDFDFEWSYDFSDKIHLFYYEKLDQKPIFDIVRKLCDSIMGCIYILPTHYVEELWLLTKKAMETLNAVGLYDDDQLLLLMAYRFHPDIFELTESKWFLPIKEYGGTHLRINVEKKHTGIEQFVIQMLVKFDEFKKRRKYFKRYLSNTKKNLMLNE